MQQTFGIRRHVDDVAQRVSVFKMSITDVSSRVFEFGRRVNDEKRNECFEHEDGWGVAWRTEVKQRQDKPVTLLGGPKRMPLMSVQRW